MFYSVDRSRLYQTGGTLDLWQQDPVLGRPFWRLFPPPALGERGAMTPAEDEPVAADEAADQRAGRCSQREHRRCRMGPTSTRCASCARPN
jgi:hypothetical protein